jgi:FixJ family two-component response regulator
VKSPGNRAFHLGVRKDSFAAATDSISITRTNDGQLRSHAFDAGAVDFLRKPFAVEDLIRAIEAAVARS